MQPGDKVHFWYRLQGTTRSFLKYGTIRSISACGKFARVEVIKCSAIKVELLAVKRLKPGWET